MFIYLRTDMCVGVFPLYTKNGKLMFKGAVSNFVAVILIFNFIATPIASLQQHIYPQRGRKMIYYWGSNNMLAVLPVL